MTKFHFFISSFVVLKIFDDFIKDSPIRNASAPLFEN